MKIEFWWRQIFEILIIHKPSLWSRDVPQKIWARSVQPFWRGYKQTDRQAKFIYRLETSWRARGCPWKKIFEKNVKFLAYFTPRLPMSVHKKCQSIRSNRLTGRREHLYYIDYTIIYNPYLIWRETYEGKILST